MTETLNHHAHLWIPVSDGTRLAARLWLPENAEADPVPAILEYIPYRKDDSTVARDASTHPWLAARGYACLRVDMRGSGSSGGLLLDEYSEQEMQDGEDVIAWIAEQPWCDGAVGMMGISWGGITGLQMAQRNAKHLKAVVALGASEWRYYDDAGYYLGCMVGQMIGWAAIMFGFGTRPPDPLRLGDAWRERWMERLDKLPLFLDTWLKHQREDDYWMRGTVGADYGTIKVPIYAVSGHADCWPNTVSRLLEKLTCPRQGLQGPWSHRYPHLAVPGPKIDFLPEVARWFDFWMKGKDTGISEDPMYRVYMQDSVRPQTYYETRPGRWISEANWPSDQVETGKFYLGANRLSAEPARAGELTLCSPQTVGMASGEYMPWFAYGPGEELPGDQQIEDAGSLVFDSDPLDGTVEILGRPVIAVEVASDRPQALLAVRICDVWPDGASTLITRGLLNLSQRESKRAPSQVVPGDRYQVEIAMNHVAYAIPAGHRLRVSLSTSYWPMAWPSPEATRLSVFAPASHLRLPLRAPDAVDAPATAFAEPVKETSGAIQQLRAPCEHRSLQQDADSGDTVLVIASDNGRVRFPETNLEMESNSEQRFSIHPDDPLSAKASYRWHWAYQRDDWSVATETTLTMTCSDATFDVTAEAIAWENDCELFRKRWDESFPRDHF